MGLFHDGLDLAQVVHHGPFHSHVGGQQGSLGAFVGGEASDGRHRSGDILGDPGRTGAGGSGGLGAFSAAQPGDVGPGSVLVGGLLVHHDAGQVAEGRAGLHIVLMGNRGDAPVEVAGAVVVVADQGGDVPVAHGHHGDVAVGEGRGVVQAGSLQLAVSAAGAGVFQILIQVVEVSQVVVLAVGQGVHAVTHGPVGDRRQPGVVVGAVDAVLGHLLGQLSVSVPGHVVGGVGNASGVEQILVVEQDPEVRAEGQRVLGALEGVVRFHADEAGHVIAFHVGGQGLSEALGLPVHDVGDLLDHEHVAGVVAGEHGARLDGVVLRGNVDVLQVDVGVGFLESLLLGDQVGGGVGVPRDDGQHLLFLGHSKAGHGQEHHRCQDQGKQLLHFGFLLLTSI